MSNHGEEHKEDKVGGRQREVRFLGNLKLDFPVCSQVTSRSVRKLTRERSLGTSLMIPVK